MTETEIDEALDFLKRYTKAGGMASEEFNKYRLSCQRVRPAIMFTKQATIVVMMKTPNKAGKRPGKKTCEYHYGRAEQAIEKHKFLSRQVSMPLAVDGSRL